MLSVDGIPSENGIFQEVSQEVKNLQEDIKTGKFKNYTKIEDLAIFQSKSFFFFRRIFR